MAGDAWARLRAAPACRLLRADHRAERRRQHAPALAAHLGRRGRGSDGGAGDANGWLWGLFFAHQNSLAIWPSPLLVIFTMAGLFIAHALVVAGDAERRIIATYPGYFDAAWKHGVQLALSFIFVALFWVVLELGAGLFKLINIDFLQRLIGHRWFALPPTTLPLPSALHLPHPPPAIVPAIPIL